MTWLGSTNYVTTRGRSILGLVIHSSEGTLEGMTTVFNRLGGASAHYAIGTDGRRWQYVRDQDVAFHVAAFGNNPALNRNRPSWLPPYNGLYSAVNACTLGVELEGYAAQGFTAAQYEGLGQLIAQKSAEHGFPLTLLPDAGPDARIITHGWLQTDRSDPGIHFDWVNLAHYLPGDDMALEPEKQMILDAAARQGLDAAGIDNLVGMFNLRGEQVTSLEGLLKLAQGERDAQAAEAERLRNLLAQGAGDTTVESVEVRLPGRVVVCRP